MDPKKTVPDNICTVHECEMEWVPNEAHPEDGYWHCELCWLEDEEDFDSEYSDFSDEE